MKYKTKQFIEYLDLDSLKYKKMKRSSLFGSHKKQYQEIKKALERR